MDEIVKAFPVGSWARSTKTERFGPLLTKGIDGEVRRHHAEAGILVRLFISRIYQPSFWFKATELKASPVVQVLPIDSDALEYMMGGRTNSVANTLIHMGVLRSWLLHRLRVAPGHPLEESIAKIDYSAMRNIWNKISNVALNEWVQYNDTRARRTTVTGTSEDLAGTSLSVRRNKLL